MKKQKSVRVYPSVRHGKIFLFNKIPIENLFKNILILIFFSTPVLKSAHLPSRSTGESSSFDSILGHYVVVYFIDARR